MKNLLLPIISIFFVYNCLEANDRIYKVKKGDTLWDLSKKYLKTPFDWPTIWHKNMFIKNPNKIYIHEQITIPSLSSRSLASYEDEHAQQTNQSISQTKNHSQSDTVVLTPQVHALNFDNNVNTDRVDNLVIKNNLHSPFKIITKDKILGKITGAYVLSHSFTLEDKVFILFNPGKEPQEKTHLSLVNFMSDVDEKDEKGNSIDAYVVTYAGEIEIIGKIDKHYKARFLNISTNVDRGTWVVASDSIIDMKEKKKSPDDITLTIDKGTDDDSKWFGEGNTVLLNKGLQSGVDVGQVYLAICKKDPYLDSDEVVDMDYKGEVQIIKTAQLSSVGFVTKSSEPLEVGDSLVPYQKIKYHNEINKIKLNNMVVRDPNDGDNNNQTSN